jgi:acetate kinase
VTDHETALKHFLEFLQENTSFKEEHIKHICHRVVHGGEYTKPTKISSESYHRIESLSDLAPL